MVITFNEIMDDFRRVQGITTMMKMCTCGRQYSKDNEFSQPMAFQVSSYDLATPSLVNRSYHSLP